MDTSHSVLLSARRFFSGTVFSRISGYLRDFVMIHCFGSAPEVAAFMVSYRLANLFRRLFGEGSMQAGLVPRFTEHQGEGKAPLYFYRDCLVSFATVLFLIMLLLEVCLWGISHFLPGDWSEIVFLSMRMIPGLIFICLYAINGAFLQAHKRYFLSGFAPVMFNGCWIFFAIYGRNLPPREAMDFLSLGVMCAFFCQWAVTLKQVHAYLPLSRQEWFELKLFSSDWRRVVRPVILGVVGVGATQANSAVDTIFSRFADLSGPAYLWYAIRIEQLPLALFGIALSGALLPPLSRAFKEGAMDRYAELLSRALRHSTAILVPCTFGIFCLGGAGLNLLYGHGAFLSSDVLKTLHCLWGYGIGLVPSVMILLMGSAFYAQKSYGTPTLISVASILFHLIINTFFVFVLQLGAFSIALSTSLAALFNCFFLARFIRTRLQVNVFAQFWGFFTRLCFAGVVASLVSLYFGYVFFDDPVFVGGDFSRSVLFQGLHLCSTGAIFILIFAGISQQLGLREVFDFMRKEVSAN